MVFTIILFCDIDILIIDRVQRVLSAKSNKMTPMIKWYARDLKDMKSNSF